MTELDPAPLQMPVDDAMQIIQKAHDKADGALNDATNAYERRDPEAADKAAMEGLDALLQAQTAAVAVHAQTGLLSDRHQKARSLTEKVDALASNAARVAFLARKL